ncbi:MAG: hypothetical protein V4710_11895 [Verrucomicrobiota bacterium]
MKTDRTVVPLFAIPCHLYPPGQSLRRQPHRHFLALWKARSHRTKQTPLPSRRREIAITPARFPDSDSQTHQP